jgi:hypothetical protein
MFLKILRRKAKLEQIWPSVNRFGAKGPEVYQRFMDGAALRGVSCPDWLTGYQTLCAVFRDFVDVFMRTHQNHKATHTAFNSINGAICPASS